MRRSAGAHTKSGVKQMEEKELPLGLGMALAQHPKAMEQFTALPEQERKMLIDGARAVHSKHEMEALVQRLVT